MKAQLLVAAASRANAIKRFIFATLFSPTFGIPYSKERIKVTPRIVKQNPFMSAGEVHRPKSGDAAMPEGCSAGFLRRGAWHHVFRHIRSSDFSLGGYVFSAFFGVRRHDAALLLRRALVP
jgi:hypothetical protein